MCSYRRNTCPVALLVMLSRAAAQSWAPCSVPQLARVCTLMNATTGAQINQMQTVCVINNGAVVPLPSAAYMCVDVCDGTWSPESFIINQSDDVINRAFAQMVQGVRAGINPNVQCPNKVDDSNHDWCHPGKPCDFRSGRAVMDGCTVEGGLNSDTCRGICVVDPAGPGSRSCWDVCNYRHDPKLYGEGAREGIEQMVTAARSDGTCPGSSWIPFILIALLILIILCCLAAVLYFARGRLGRKGKSSRPAGGQTMNPIPEVQHAEMADTSMSRDMVDDRMPEQQQYYDEQRAPAPPQPPQQQYYENQPSQQQYFESPPAAPTQYSQPAQGNIFGMAEPNLKIPTLQPPPQSFSQVPASPMTQGPIQGVGPSTYSYSQTAPQGYAVSTPLLASGTPMAFQTQQYQYR